MLNNILFFRSVSAFLKDKEYRDLLITSTVIIGMGSTVYHFLEGWTLVDSVYFSVITLTTIGYGDFAPQKDGGKLFTMFYILIGLGMILSFIQSVYDHFAYMKDSGKRNDSA